MNRLRVAGLAGLMVALVSCSSAGTAATPTPSPTPTATPPATPSAAASNALPSFTLPSNAKELEALLPDTLGGVKLTKASMKGTDFVNSASSSPELKAWLDSVGKSLNDVSAAYAFDLTGKSPAAVFAFRVQGVDHTQLIDKLKTSMQSDGTVTSWTSANVGGKDVQQGEASDGTLYVYGTADIVFFVKTDNATLAAEALSHLP